MTSDSHSESCWNCGTPKEETNLAYSKAVDDLVCVRCGIIEHETGRLPAEGE